MNIRIKGTFLFLFITAIALTGCGLNNKSVDSGAGTNTSGTQPKDQPLKEVTVGITASGIVYGPMYVAMEKNIFKKYGLKVNLVSLDSAATTAGVISGDVPIAFSGGNIVDAALKSDKVKVIGTIGTIPYTLYTKNITKVEELKGKVIGVSSAGGNNENAALSLIRAIGLQPGKDVKILYVGTNILPTISEGKVEAGILVPPMTVQADQMGLKKVATLTDIKGIQGTYMVGGVNQPFAEKNPQVVESFFKAYAEASKLTQTEKEATKAALGKYTKVTDDSALDASYEYFKSFWPTDFHIPENEIKFLLEQLAATTNPAAKTKKPADIMDQHYVDAIK
ncbi:ABC transporter substrate-binding protein [Paenibacillus alginolyticus]|uniref:ABC transporter substrate-binding protein n=1 Tax=Paenibacillus alginolyticus TaxID=59839 RepID=A0ABT4G8Z5_9BACL|nr:ABC transporter substrate-binding protein [Paenibacillus alginolyticus]MCY9692654.1 ABC transporter substrate-binding protein [Paenibacillus alginolyticus]MEC0148757.1 ABC transporter substrate-binding protein [Paenibacillus alginolyticus]